MNYTEADYSLFYVTSADGIIIRILYIDDLLIRRSDFQKNHNLEKKLMGQFDTTDLGNVRYYLGLEFYKSDFEFFFSPRQILEEFDMKSCTLVSVSIPNGLNLGAETNSPQVIPQCFQKLIQILMYLVNTKLEITHATCLFSQFMHNS